MEGQLVIWPLQSRKDQCPQENKEFLMECTYSNDGPWINVALAVVQQVG